MTITRKLSIDWGVTGLDGTLAFHVVDANNADLIARATAGVVEFPSGSGEYSVKITTWDVSWEGLVIWDDGAGNFASEVIPQIVLSPIGLDGISTADPSGSSSGWTFRQFLVWIFRRLGKAKVDSTANTLSVYGADGTTVLSAQAVTTTGAVSTDTTGAIP